MGLLKKYLKMRQILLVVASLVLLLIIFEPAAFAAGATPNEKIFVEIFLSPDHKNDLDAIKKAFETHSIRRVKAQFFTKGNPPTNIAIGSEIPADIARFAIDLSIKYNRGITHLLPQFRFFPNQIAIGTSAFDELVPVAIRPEDLEQLKDPTLSDTQFRKRYRDFTGEKQKVDKDGTPP